MGSWKRSSVDFYNESIPPDDDPDDEDDDEDSEGEETSDVGPNFLKLWATAVLCGISDSEWENVTVLKIRALNKARREREKFEIKLHGMELNKTAKKAKYLSDLGYFPK
ncbi:MAG: hypothetical protein JWM44_1323 [Bacilli bacterium]|nr:hypothetical protein [Bacilli bacterium]